MGTNWATHAIEALERNESAVINPRGNSMQPLVTSGATVTLAPYPEHAEPAEGDIVLVRVRGTVYLHLIKALRGKADDRQFQIGNNRGGINGWVSRRGIYGKAVHVGPR